MFLEKLCTQYNNDNDNDTEPYQRRDTLTQITDYARDVTDLREISEEDSSVQHDGDIEDTMSIQKDSEDSTTDGSNSMIGGLNKVVNGAPKIQIPIIQPHIIMGNMTLPTNANNHKYPSHHEQEEEDSVWTETNMEDLANAKSVRMIDINQDDDGGAIGGVVGDMFDIVDKQNNPSDEGSNDNEDTKIEDEVHIEQEGEDDIEIVNINHKSATLSAKNMNETEASSSVWTEDVNLDDHEMGHEKSEKSMKMIDENILSSSGAVGSMYNMFGLAKIDESKTGTNTQTISGNTNTYNNHQHENTFTETESRSVY